jgi:outer membrane protein assembly factor BamB
MRSLLACCMLMLAHCTIYADSATWPQFRGPNGTGVIEGQKPPIEFGPTTNVKWKIECGSGFSSPIVVGQKIILTTFENNKLYTVAFSSETGKELWRVEAPAEKIEAFHATEGSPAASTPVSDGVHIISYFGSAGLFCYDLEGKQLWDYKLPMAVTNNDFGTGVSPVLIDGVVILVRDLSKDSKILALDAKTGSLLWQKSREGFVTSYSTPGIWQTKSGKELVVPGALRIKSYDAKTGNEKWTISGTPAVTCTTPVAGDGLLLFAGWSPGGSDEFKMPKYDDLLKTGDADGDGAISREESSNTFLKGFFNNNDTNKDGKITRDEWDTQIKFMTSGKNVALAVRPGGEGEISNSHVAWRKFKGLPYVSSPIFYDGTLYVIKDGGLLSAFEGKTGKEVYLQERLGAGGGYYSSPVAANGHIYFSSLEGAITVLKAGGTSPEIIMTAKFGERIAATPAIAHDRLYLRTATKLYAIGK